MFLKLKRYVLTLERIKDVPSQSTLKEKAVERVETYKYLGVVFDRKLNWKENINSVLKKSELKNVLLEKAEIFWGQFRYVFCLLLFLYIML